MEIMPSEYQHIKLSRNEKVFVRTILSNDGFGYLLINVNPAMLENESMHVLICSEGVLLLKFFEDMDDADAFSAVMPIYVKSVFTQTVRIVTAKLHSNKTLVDDQGLLKFPINIVYIFPSLNKDEVVETCDEQMRLFAEENCMFKADIQRLRTEQSAVLSNYLSHSIAACSESGMIIENRNVNSILQRITPEYVTIRVSDLSEGETQRGADAESLVVTENDLAVRAFRLDEEQINIVNRITKGEQLILACAGSGKSVLLIAKCFKAAAMNPDKQFLITCYNTNLYSLYTWFIDRAGLRAKNVQCLTFHTLCRKLLKDNGFSVSRIDFDGWIDKAIKCFNAGQIKERFYGIFIDEVQQFDTEWYKLCYNLLENKNTEDHLFVICGDKTQKLTRQQKHGRAPWNAGEGYPNYRGGYKTIRIERNYRNCIEINEYINRFVSSAKQYLYHIQSDAGLDPDMFLRGKSDFHGNGVYLKRLTKRTCSSEAKEVVRSIQQIHDEKGIPYDEIAVIMFNIKFSKRLSGWGDKHYNLEIPLMAAFKEAGIPFCRMYGNDENWSARYGDDGGVRFIKFYSVLGLDFRAAIICGLMPLGEYNMTKKPNWEVLKLDEEKFQEQLRHAQEDIRLLYVACTRAKEELHIILPETAKESVYMKMLEEADHEKEVYDL